MELSGFTVFIKTPHETGDLPIPNLRGQLAVRELKQAIAESHPLQPDVSQMRLIFAGRVLADQATLNEVFAPVRDPSLLWFKTFRGADC